MYCIDLCMHIHMCKTQSSLSAKNLPSVWTGNPFIMWAPPYWSYRPLEAWSRFATSERPQWNSSAPHHGELKSEKHGLPKSSPCHGRYDMFIYTSFEIDIHVINTVRKCVKEISIFTCTFNIYFPGCIHCSVKANWKGFQVKTCQK